MSIQPKKFYTEAEYLKLERAANFKSEFYKGEIFAMSGASVQHTIIAGNIFASLHQQLRKKPCTVHASDLRVRVEKNTLYTYPDIVVVCGDAKFSDEQKDTLTNPTLIVEVLSKSTEQYDRVKKFELYRGLDSLREYVLVSQNEFRIELFTKQNEQQWIFSEVTDKNGVLTLQTIDASLSIPDVYEKIIFAYDL